MKIAAGRQHQPPFETRLQFIAALLYQFGNKRVIRVRMRRANDVRNSVRDRHFRHLHGHFNRIGTVIKPGKYVAMNINHVSRE